MLCSSGREAVSTLPSSLPKLHNTPPSMQENRGAERYKAQERETCSSSNRRDAADLQGRAHRRDHQAWCESWTGAKLIAALEKRGCLLAREDQRGLYRQGLQWRD